MRLPVIDRSILKRLDQDAILSITMNRHRLLASTVAALCIVWTYPARLLAREIDPAANFCEAINQLSPGEELVLKEGDYQGPCGINRGGEPGHRLTIRAANLNHRPRIVYNSRSASVLEIRASHVVIQGLEFGPTQQDIDAIRIFSGNDVVVQDCVFTRLGGIAVVANHESVSGLLVTNNRVTDSSATAMYFGCHDGVECVISDLRVESNFIERIDAPPGQVGYGIQIKLNSIGVIRNNTIATTKGPPIMIYGLHDAEKPNVVENNIVSGSRTSSGIVVGGGPAIIRDNISNNNAEAAVALEDYDKRGLLRGLVITRNSGENNPKGAILAPLGVRYETESPLESSPR